jgi:hypothetical protein
MEQLLLCQGGIGHTSFLVLFIAGLELSVNLLFIKHAELSPFALRWMQHTLSCAHWLHNVC